MILIDHNQLSKKQRMMVKPLMKAVGAEGMGLLGGKMHNDGNARRKYEQELDHFSEKKRTEMTLVKSMLQALSHG